MTIRRFRSGHGSLGGILRGVPRQMWKMRALWRAQDLRRRLPKSGAGPQVAVAFETASLSAASKFTTFLMLLTSWPFRRPQRPADLLRLSVSDGGGPGLSIEPSFATFGAVLPSECRRDCHGCGSRMQKEQKRLKKGQNDSKKDKRWRSLDDVG